MEEPLTVSELIEATGMKQGNVSKHLGVLLNARFVAREQEGNFARYSLADKRLYQLCDLVCMRIEDDACQRAKEFGAIEPSDQGRTHGDGRRHRQIPPQA
jgi:DNA-binding transcriptional ArsR family regulator